MRRIIQAIAATALAATLLACGLGGNNNEVRPVTGGQPSVEATTATALTAKDFKPSLKIKSKKCYEYIGCTVQYSLQIAIVDEVREKLDRDGRSYEITYEVQGGDSGPQSDTVTIAPDGTFTQYDGFVTVPSRSTKLKVKLTGVERMVY